MALITNLETVSPTVIARFQQQFDQDELSDEAYEWDFVNEGTNADDAAEMVQATLKCERDSRVWIMLQLGEDGEERLIIAPLLQE